MLPLIHHSLQRMVSDQHLHLLSPSLAFPTLSHPCYFQVPATHPAAVHSGWLVLRPTGSKAATSKRFFLLLPDYVLYSFRSPADTSALTATPLPGSTVLTGPGLKGDSGCAEKDREKVVKVVHGASRRTYYFAGTSAGEMERWAELMAQAARAEPLPQPEGSDSQSTSSTEFDNS